MEKLVEGRLGPADFGFTMPVSNPPIDRPPYYFRNMESMTFFYETSTEAAAAILPEGLMLPETTSTAMVSFNRFHFSTVGTYSEAIFGIKCFWQGEPVIYHDTLLVNSEVGMITGREPYGYPKIFGHIHFERENNLMIACAERPKGKRLVTGVVRPRDPLVPGPAIASVTLKMIPSPEEGAPPEVCELVMLRVDKHVVTGSDGKLEAFTGPGNVSFDSESVINPIFKLPVQKMVSASWGMYNFTLPYGKVIKRYAPTRPGHVDVNGVPRPA